MSFAANEHCMKHQRHAAGDKGHVLRTLADLAWLLLPGILFMA